MVITVNLNPNIDRLIKVEEFNYGGMNRIVEKKDDVTSKGINASTVLKRLHADTLCMGFMYEENGALAVAALVKEGILHDFVWQPGSVRINMKLLDQKTSVITEINDRGVPVEKKYLEALKQRIFDRAGKDDIIAVTGSLPPGCPEGFFAEVIEEANKKGIRCALDAEGEVLQKGAAAKPFFIKINRFELETLSGKSMESERAIAKECQAIVAGGVKLIAVSMGAKGAILTDGNITLKAEGIKITPKSPTGSGDSMLAGMLAGIIKNRPLDEVLRMGTAAATATALCEGTELMTFELYESLLGRVNISRL